MGNVVPYETFEVRGGKIEFNKGFSGYLFWPLNLWHIQLVYKISQQVGSRNCLIMAMFDFLSSE